MSERLEISSAPERVSLSSDLSSLRAMLPLYQADKVKAEMTLARILPVAADSEIELTRTGVRVTIFPGSEPLSSEMLAGIGRNLALEIGVPINVRQCTFDKYLPASDLAVLRSILLTFSEIEGVSRGTTRNFLNVSIVGEPTKSLRQAFERAGISVTFVEAKSRESDLQMSFPATIPVEVITAQEQTSPQQVDLLAFAREFVTATALPTTVEPSVMVRESLRQVLSQVVAPERCQFEIHGRSLSIRIESGSSLLKEPDFYQATQQLLDRCAGQYVLRIEIVEPQPTTSANSKQLVTSELTQADVAIRLATQHALAQFGTRQPFLVRYCAETDQAVIKIRMIGGVVPSTQSEAVNNLKAMIGRVRFEPLALAEDIIDNKGKRKQISTLQMEQICERARDLLGHDRKNVDWAKVYSDGNILTIDPKFPLSASFRDIIAEKLMLLPIPIRIKKVERQRGELSAEDLKSICKLALPAGISLLGIEFDSERNLSTIRVATSRRPWDMTEGVLDELFAPLTLDRIQVLPQFYSEKAGIVLSRISHRHAKEFLRNNVSEGEIDLTTWQRSDQRKRASDLGYKSRVAISELLRINSHLLKDYRDKRLVTIDSERALRRDDGFTVEHLSPTQKRIGVHSLNAALLSGEFSRDRFEAYRKGTSVYVDGMVAHMNPLQNRSTLAEGHSRPAASVFFCVNIHGSSMELDLSHPEIEMTIVENKQAIHFREDGSQQLINVPADFAEDVQILQKVGALLGSSQFPFIPHGGAHFIRHLLAFSNHTIATELVRNQLPVIFQKSSKPTFEALQKIVAAFPIEMQAMLLKNDLEQLYQDDKQIRELASRIIILRGRENLHHIDISPLRETISTDPNSSSFFSGYAPQVIANKGARDIEALIALHQISALHGLMSPLSSGEVTMLFDRDRSQRSMHLKVASELRMLKEIELLAYAAQHGKPVEARVEHVELNGTRVLRVRLGGDRSTYGKMVASAVDSEQQGLLPKVGDTVMVMPSRYNFIEDCFYLHPASAQATLEQNV